MRDVTRQFDPGLIVRKFFVSAFVVATFAAYAIHQHFSGSAGAANGSVPTKTTAQDQPALAQSQPLPTAIPPTDVQTGLYRDGSYKGMVADAYYGQVQVQVNIQNGKIANVQFLDYPHDRRTSQYINSQAMPMLQSETVQAQNAQVDFISGATLTSQAFVQSLQSALDQAKL